MLKFMKIQAIKSVNTVSPEKHWLEGEICDLPEKVGKQLLGNPNFRIVETSEASLGDIIKEGLIPLKNLSDEYSSKTSVDL